jgi:hypothetical protein
LFLELPGIAGDRTLALARPVKAPLHNQWRTCGRRERGTDARDKVGGAIRRLFARCGRNGGRHPGLRDGVDLRGSASERRPWFGPASGTGSSPLGDAPATADVQRTPRKGATSACTLRSACTGREKRGNAHSLAPAEDASFTWSSDPCTLIATATPSGQLAEVARSNRYRGRANLVEARRNRHRGLCERTMRGSPPVTASARERAWQVRKGRASRRSSLRGL